MILWIRNRFRNLSLYHYAVIVVTIFFPVGLGLIVAYPAIECLVVRVIVYSVLFVVWALFVVIVVALLVERDAVVANRFVTQQTDPLAEKLNQVKEVSDEHESLIENIRLQMADLERRSRSTFEELGANLPPRAVDLHGSVTLSGPTLSGTLTISGGSRWGRFRQWFRRAVLKAWRVIYGDARGGQ